MAFNPPKYKPGDRLPTAAAINTANDEIRRLDRVRTGPGLTGRSGAGGVQVALDLPEIIFIKLTGGATSSAYPWKEVVHTPPNTWVDSARTGVVSGAAADPAYSLDGSTSLAAGNRVYQARRAPTSGVWIFD